MKLRKRYLLVAGVLGATIAAMPAIASSGSPSVSGTASIMWSPMEVTVATGGTVMFQNTSGIPHGIIWESGPATPICESSVPVGAGHYSSSWSGSCTFPTEGTYAYYCSYHGKEMSGKVIVNAGETTTATTVTTPTATTTTTTMTTSTMVMPTTPAMTGSSATGAAPPVPSGEPRSGHEAVSPLSGSAPNAIKLARTQHGRSVHGSLQISQAGVGAHVEIELLASAASLGNAGRSTQVRVGRLVRSALKAGTASFSITLSTQGQAALRRHGHLPLTVKITVTPVEGVTTVLKRVIVVHA